MFLDQNYSLIGDTIALVFCICLFCFIRASVINNGTKFKILKNSLRLTMLAAVCSMIYHTLIDYDFINYFLYIPRSIYYLSLMGIFICYNLYLDRLIDIDNKTRNTQRNFLLVAYIFFSVLTLISPITKFGFHIADGQVQKSYFFDPFTFAYIFFILCIGVGLFKYKDNFSDKVFNCILIVTSLSVGTIIIQTIFEHHSFTVISFLYPIVMMFYLFHSSSYNYNTGTLNRESCSYYLLNNLKNNKEFEVLFLELKDFYKSNLFYRKLKKILNMLFKQFFNEPYSFQLKDNLFCLVYKPKKDFSKENFVNAFENLYTEFNEPFKIVIIKPSVSNNLDSLDKIETFYYWNSEKMEFNDIKIVTELDMNKYHEEIFILSQLKDISDKKDLNDERVLVFCQPIWNTEKKQFISAEILMRLNLCGLVLYPNSFIELAEKYNYIHSLSLIILNKACVELKKILNEGYILNRISVNFSMMELNESNFCNDIKNIIESTSINASNIAIELTESREDKDFFLVENKINELKKMNIKFYLDDFGTGYSNFERIMKLPIDIIKFDRSLLLMSAKNNESKYMVNHFAEIFNNLNFEILFEGVENDEDENICMDMNANYLQGYKYSKPIPFEQIRKFLVKA